MISTLPKPHTQNWVSPTSSKNSLTLMRLCFSWKRSKTVLIKIILNCQESPSNLLAKFQMHYFRIASKRISTMMSNFWMAYVAESSTVTRHEWNFYVIDLFTINIYISLVAHSAFFFRKRTTYRTRTHPLHLVWVHPWAQR